MNNKLFSWHRLKNVGIWIGLGLLTFLLLSICAWVGSVMTYSSVHSLSSVPTQRADQLLSALQGRDQKSLAQILSDSEKAPTLLQQWDRLVANVGPLESWKRTHVRIEPMAVEIVVGEQSFARVTLVFVEYEAKFERLQCIITVKLEKRGADWKVLSVSSAFDILAE